MAALSPERVMWLNEINKPSIKNKPMSRLCPTTKTVKAPYGRTKTVPIAFDAAGRQVLRVR